MTVLNNLLWISITSGIIYAAIMLFKTIFKNHLSPVLMYMVWVILIARLLLPITPDAGISLIPKFDAPAMQREAVSQQANVQADSAGISKATLPITDAEPNDVPAAERQAGQAETIPPFTNQTGFDFDPVGTALFVWLMGAAIMIIRLLFESLRLQNRIKTLANPPPPAVQKLAVQIQSGINIKQPVQIAVLLDIDSPALSAVFRPVLLIPERTALKGGGQLAFALRHELMHLKRRDHLVCLFLNFLRAAYWFNPVVWLAVRQIKADMETACDSMVVESMNPEEKIGYARTVLNMYAAKKQKHLALGMAPDSTRKLAERRIRGIYMRARSGKKAKAAAVLLSAVILFACFTTACQPEAFQSNAVISVISGQYREIKNLNGIVTVKYDADVIQPSAVPRAALQMGSFTEADMQKVADCFLPDRQLYEPWTLTKNELQIQIDSLKRKIKEPLAKKDAFIAQHAWAEELYEAYVDANTAFADNDRTERIITKYGLSERDVAAFKAACYYAGINEPLLRYKTEMLATAPDTAAKKPDEIRFRYGGGFSSGPLDIGEKKYTNYIGMADGCTLWSENADGTISQIDGYNQYGGYFNWVAYYRAFPSESKPLTIPQDQAQRIAEQAAAAVSPDLKLSDLSSETFDYVFSFTRRVAGVPISYDATSDYMYGYQQGSEVIITPYETLKIKVNDSGVSRLEWRNPYTDIRITEKNAKVISMDEAKQKFEANILAALANGKYADDSDADQKMDSITLNIDRIELGLTRIQDGEGYFFLVPTWDFFGKATAMKDGQEQIFNRFGLDCQRRFENVVKWQLNFVDKWQKFFVCKITQKEYLPHVAFVS